MTNHNEDINNKSSQKVFQSVIDEIRKTESSLSAEQKDLINLLNESTVEDFLADNGKLYFKNNFAIYNSKGKQQFFNILQNNSEYWNIFESEHIRKAVQQVNKKLNLWFIGSSFSGTMGKFAIFEGELDLPKLFVNLDFEDNLTPQIWRDIKSYREKGIRDIKTEEGILGTEVANKNEVVTNHWDFNITEENGRYLLEVVCVGVAVVLWKTELTTEEKENMKHYGLKYIKEISETFRYSPNKFAERRMK